MPTELLVCEYFSYDLTYKQPLVNIISFYQKPPEYSALRGAGMNGERGSRGRKQGIIDFPGEFFILNFYCFLTQKSWQAEDCHQSLLAVNQQILCNTFGHGKDQHSYH
jgi:hypothetical protein